jgi:hypothetical protein
MRRKKAYRFTDALIVQHLRIHILNNLHQQFSYLQG